MCRLLLLAGAAAALARAPAAHAGATSAPAVSELAVKAAFLPRFARYVTWPPGARPGSGEPVVLCTVGSDPFGGLLDQAVSGQLVDGHRVVVRRLAAHDGAAGCHVAFVGGNQERPTGQLLAAMAQQPVLTVTDSRTGTQRGIIHFVIDRGRVRFFIDEAAAARRRMSISSRLLGLAVAVRAR